MDGATGLNPLDSCCDTDLLATTRLTCLRAGVKEVRAWTILQADTLAP